jgi:hypothetical protein
LIVEISVSLTPCHGQYREVISFISGCEKFEQCGDPDALEMGTASFVFVGSSSYQSTESNKALFLESQGATVRPTKKRKKKTAGPHITTMFFGCARKLFSFFSRTCGLLAFLIKQISKKYIYTNCNLLKN